MSPDINLGPGDTAPILEQVLVNPNKADGSPGDPLNLTGATVVLRIQPQDGTVAAVDRAVTVTSPATSGATALDWLASGGRLDAGGNPSGIDYNARYIVTYTSGHQISIPNGIDPFFGESNVREFLWLRVAADFVTVS